MIYANSVIARGKAALQGSETEQRIAVLLYDDAVQTISSFELNQLASLTYHDTAMRSQQQHTDGTGTLLSPSSSPPPMSPPPPPPQSRDMTDILLDHLEQIQSQPVGYSVISVLKSLVVTGHILLHGAERIVPRIRQQLGRHVAALCEYNTVLAATTQQQQQQQQATTTGTVWFTVMHRVMGGSVDTAGPVREEAVRLHALLDNNSTGLQRARSAAADPASLVPVGDRRQVAFLSDRARLERLTRRMHEEQATPARSNLAKASDGFGSGYAAANGRAVVGAAHGIEEMLRRQQKEEQRFSDEASHNRNSSNSNNETFSEYKAPNFYSAATTTNTTQQQQQQQQQQQYEPDLLALDLNDHPSGGIPSNAVTADLLDFGSITNNNSSSSTSYPPQQHAMQEDLLFGSVATALPQPASASAATDIYAATTTTTTTTTTMMTTPHDPFQVVAAPVSATMANPSPSSFSVSSPFAVSNLLGNLSLGSSNGNSNNTTSASAAAAAGLAEPSARTVSAKPHSVMSPNEDRFAALDALAGFGGAGARSTTRTATASSFAGLASFAHTVPPPAAAGAPFSALADLRGFATPTATAPSLSMMSMQQQQQQQSMAFAIPVSLSSIRVSQPLGNDSEHSNDNGFLMGGSQGTGLEPVGQAPAAPPPPPGTFYG